MLSTGMMKNLTVISIELTAGLVVLSLISSVGWYLYGQGVSKDVAPFLLPSNQSQIGRFKEPNLSASASNQQQHLISRLANIEHLLQEQIVVSAKILSIPSKVSQNNRPDPQQFAQIGKEVEELRLILARMDNTVLDLEAKSGAITPTFQPPANDGTRILEHNKKAIRQTMAETSSLLRSEMAKETLQLQQVGSRLDRVAIVLEQIAKQNSQVLKTSPQDSVINVVQSEIADLKKQLQSPNLLKPVMEELKAQRKQLAEERIQALRTPSDKKTSAKTDPVSWISMESVVAALREEGARLAKKSELAQQKSLAEMSTQLQLQMGKKTDALIVASKRLDSSLALFEKTIAENSRSTHDDRVNTYKIQNSLETVLRSEIAQIRTQLQDPVLLKPVMDALKHQETKLAGTTVQLQTQWGKKTDEIVLANRRLDRSLTILEQKIDAHNKSASNSNDLAPLIQSEIIKLRKELHDSASLKPLMDALKSQERVLAQTTTKLQTQLTTLSNASKGGSVSQEGLQDIQADIALIRKQLHNQAGLKPLVEAIHSQEKALVKATGQLQTEMAKKTDELLVVSKRLHGSSKNTLISQDAVLDTVQLEIAKLRKQLQDPTLLKPVMDELKMQRKQLTEARIQALRATPDKKESSRGEKSNSISWISLDSVLDALRQEGERLAEESEASRQKSVKEITAQLKSQRVKGTDSVALEKVQLEMAKLNKQLQDPALLKPVMDELKSQRRQLQGRQLQKGGDEKAKITSHSTDAALAKMQLEMAKLSKQLQNPASNKEVALAKMQSEIATLSKHLQDPTLLKPVVDELRAQRRQLNQMSVQNTTPVQVEVSHEGRATFSWLSLDSVVNALQDQGNRIIQKTMKEANSLFQSEVTKKSDALIEASRRLDQSARALEEISHQNSQSNLQAFERVVQAEVNKVRKQFQNESLLQPVLDALKVQKELWEKSQNSVKDLSKRQTSAYSERMNPITTASKKSAIQARRVARSQRLSDPDASNRVWSFVGEKVGYFIAIGCFANPFYRDDLAYEVEKLDLPVYTRKVSTRKQSLDCVLVGPLSNRQEAEQSAQMIRENSWVTETLIHRYHTN